MFCSTGIEKSVRIIVLKSTDENRFISVAQV